jgi:hypothetical protein
MKQTVTLLLLVLIPFLFLDCKKKSDNSQSPGYGQMTVVISNTPFKTEKYLRIPYTLKTWEFRKDGLSLQQIIVLDDNTKTVLQTLDKNQIPKIWSYPFPPSPWPPFDKIDSYYLSIQLPIDLSQAPPARVSHRFVFRDTVQGMDVTVEGGAFNPKLNETPVAISSPVRGKNWNFFNQSTNDYHFYEIMFLNGKLGTGERFGFDNGQLSDDFKNYLDGDSAVNTSYFNYGDTLYAVADGVVIGLRDSLPENHGNKKDVTFAQPIDLAGNYLILNIGGGFYAFYAHCIPHSFMVQLGDTVKEGVPVGLLGNSGNSTGPHLHFQVGDSPDFFNCNGQPFVLKKYTKIGEFGNPDPFVPTDYTNIMMEQWTILRFD